MADKTRIYAVKKEKDNTITLVEAGTPASARGHVARHDYSVAVATQREIATLVGAGAKIEKPGEEPQEKGGDDGDKK